MDFEDCDFANFENYYGVLGVSKNASTEEVQKAYDEYFFQILLDLNNALARREAERVLKAIIPEIKRHLLFDKMARQKYDRCLALWEQRAVRLPEPADNQGLDNYLQNPFFFDEEYGPGVEEPSDTLRKIARKLDEDWLTTKKWITDTSRKRHRLVNYLEISAGRPSLAKRVEAIIQTISADSANTSESALQAIEQCITLLDPESVRPKVAVCYQNIEEVEFDIGRFVPDEKASATLTLRLDKFSSRGCAFGVIESRISQITFEGGNLSMRYTLLPRGTPESVGPTEKKVKVYFDISHLTHNTKYGAMLLLRMENHEPAIEYQIPITFYVTALPPRVSFDILTPKQEVVYIGEEQQEPLWIGKQRRGEKVQLRVMLRNSGDEKSIPLTARIHTSNASASAIPKHVGANHPVKLTIDTSNYPCGQQYDVTFNVNYVTLDVDYRPIPGAKGPSALHIRGELLPTAWQSFFREASLSSRIAWGCGMTPFIMILLFINWVMLLAVQQSLNDIASISFVTLLVLFTFITIITGQHFIKHTYNAGKIHNKVLLRVVSWIIAPFVGLLAAWFWTKLSIPITPTYVIIIAVSVGIFAYCFLYVNRFKH